MSAVTGPNASNGPADSFEIFSDQVLGLLDQLQLRGITADDIKELSENILDLPPDERFTQSISVFVEGLGPQSEGSLDISSIEESPLVEQMIPVFIRSLEDMTEELQRRSLKFVEANREEAEEALVIAVYFEKWKSAVKSAYNMGLSDEVNETILSTSIALNSRLVRFHNDNSSSLYEDLANDIVYANYYLAEAMNETPPTHPSELSKQRIWEQVLAVGAIKAYQDLDISLGRGAELAHMSHDQFEAALSERGIQPEQGPDSDEPLYDESEDWF